MTVAGLLAMLVLAIVGGCVLAARVYESHLEAWPVMRTDVTRSEPADEGAAVAEGGPQAPGPDLRKAA